MKKLINSAIFLFALFAIYLTSTAKVSADGTYGTSGCVPVYGGGVQCPRVGQVLINKTVRNPSTGIYVDNLGPTDPKYRPEWLVNFQVTVQNTGDQTLSDVKVTDTLPQYVDFTSGPGTYDSKSRTLTFDVLNLAGGTSQTFAIVARVVHAAVLPANQSVVCPVNTVDAVTADTNQTDHDTSQFCVEKQMVVPAAPAAGPQHWILSFAGLGTVLTIGLYLRKRTVIS